jgi:signal transduction histidine kinase
MKLLNYTGRNYLRFSAIIFLIAGIAIYWMIISLINEEIDERLFFDRERIAQNIKSGKETASIPPVLEIKLLSDSLPLGIKFRDTLMIEPLEQEHENFRELVTVEKINDKYYKISVRQKLIETEDYIFSIGLPLGSALILVLFSVWWLNRILSKKAWLPFFENLEILRKFSLDEDKAVSLKQSDIHEFRQLNIAIEKLTDYVRKEYSVLKQFTENASHEIQTPLAIISSKLEEALQSPELPGDSAAAIISAFNAAGRLSKLNKSLLLMTKIDNKQFKKTEEINLEKLTNDILIELEDLVQLKKLKIYKSGNCNFAINADFFLTDTLFRNLIWNSIKHNIHGGKINIACSENEFCIENTGKHEIKEPKTMFGRFVKGEHSSSSPGLGLSIVKQVCDTYGWVISYTTENNIHKFKIKFQIQN